MKISYKSTVLLTFTVLKNKLTPYLSSRKATHLIYVYVILL